jgi:hypothetical protein
MKIIGLSAAALVGFSYLASGLYSQQTQQCQGPPCKAEAEFDFPPWGFTIDPISKKSGQAANDEGVYCPPCKPCKFLVSGSFVGGEGWSVFYPGGWAGGGPGSVGDFGFTVFMECDEAYKTASFSGGEYGPYNLYFYCPCEV